MSRDDYKIRPLKESQCELCFKWYSKKILKNGVCPECLEEMRLVPDSFSIEDKKDFIRNIKAHKKSNIFKYLTTNEKTQLQRCEKCEWLRNIDYLNLKIHCASPICKKVV